ncbi:MAG: tail fiber domain-containing protein [Flavobacteriales bacterium]|nr:tail fiber domain-containing protein [Flavobacteriales bacterium]
MLSMQGYAQVTQTNNNILLANPYLGCNAGSTQPLRIYTKNNFPINFRTADIDRMRLNETVTTTINGYTTAKNGFLGLSPTGTFWSGGLGNPGPFSRLHLDDGGNPLLGTYRPWMRNGIYMSGNNDMMYVGQLYRAGQDESDAVIAWGDNKYSPAGPDHLRFLFMGNGYEGEEVTRINGDGFFGIGNFDIAGQDPNERLDLINRTIRIRRLIPDYNNDTLSRVVVVDSTGRLHWRRISTWPPTGGGGGGCEWTLSGGANNNNVLTAFGTSTICPNDANRVGIGTTNPLAKLHVRVVPGSAANYGAYFHLDNVGGAGAAIEVNGPGLFNVGADVNVQGAQSATWTEGNVGVRSNALAGIPGYTYSNRAYTGNASVGAVGGVQVTDNFIFDGQTSVGSTATVVNNYGFRAQLWNYGTVTNNYGGHFWSWGPPGTLTNSYGVLAIAEGGTNNYGLLAYAPVAANSNAAWIAGTGVITGGAWSPSDASLKTDIQELALDQATSPLDQLHLHTYSYDLEQFPYMGLPVGEQVGLLAQELEEVLPRLVTEVTAPEHKDREGNILQSAVPFKAVNYTGLIPYLVAGYQAQQQQLAEQGARIAQMQEQLAACCAGLPVDADQRDLLNQAVPGQAADRTMTIAPNPFEGQTTIRYKLDHSGRMQLMANSADGKQLRVLNEANLEADQYQFEWNTSDLAPGLYYVTLLLDGEPIVKKAVKVK